jgi:hypothetical protein
VPDLSLLTIAVGDQVRILYHPPGLRQSFAEGVVSRVEVTTLRGHGFLIDTTREVILGREQVVKPGCQGYVLYEHPNEFPGRIEVLSQADRFIETKPEEEQPAEPEPHSAAEQAAEANRSAEPEPDQEERQTSRGLGNVISAVFGRRA